MERARPEDLLFGSRRAYDAFENLPGLHEGTPALIAHQFLRR